MKFILDSSAFIDIAINAPTISIKALSAYQNEDNELYLSVATVWELGLKRSLGKLDFDITGAIELLSQCISSDQVGLIKSAEKGLS